MTTVGEVTKLSLPDGQSVWIRNAVAILEAQNSILAEQTVLNLEVLMFIWLQDISDGCYLLVCLLVHQHGVAMTECSSFYVLARQSDIEALFQETGKGKCLGSGKVNRLTSIDAFSSLVVDLLDHGMHIEALRNLAYF